MSVEFEYKDFHVKISKAIYNNWIKSITIKKNDKKIYSRQMRGNNIMAKKRAKDYIDKIDKEGESGE